MTAITRNPFDRHGTFVSEWYGFETSQGMYRPGVIVAWQGQRDAEPRILWPWEFIRADEQTKSVDFIVAGHYETAEDIQINKQHAGSIGGLKIHNGPLQDCGICINTMQNARWWELDPTDYDVIHVVKGMGGVPYYPEQIKTHFELTAKHIENLKGNLL